MNNNEHHLPPTGLTLPFYVLAKGMNLAFDTRGKLLQFAPE